jgi:hypothetical protein
MPGSRGRVAGVALLSLVFLAAGCGGSSDKPSNGFPSSDSTASTGTATATATGTDSPAPTPIKAKKKKNVVAWILSLGPGAPSGPPEFTAYRELQQLRCSKVFDRVAELQEPARTLYVGAARACLAAFNGRNNLWPRSAAAYDAVAGRSGELTCMDRAAFALLERLLTLHSQHPDRSFRDAPTTEAHAPPCPRIRRLTPDHGPAGTLVRMTGRHLGADVAGVDVVDSNGSSQPAENVTGVGGGLQFTMPAAPPSEASASVCIVVRAAPDWSADGAMFTYESQNAGPPTTFACPPPEAG